MCAVKRAILVVLLLWSVGSRATADAPPTPADAVVYAYADLLTLPAETRPYTRYLSVNHLTAREKVEAVRVMSYHLNSLSRNPELVPPTVILARPVLFVVPLLLATPVVPAVTLSNVGMARDCLMWDAILLRIDLRNYRDSDGKGKGFPTKVWERLAGHDPHFHVQLTKDWEGGVWPGDKKNYAAGSFKYQIPASAPWLFRNGAEKANLAKLLLLTESQVPLVRADWFFNQSAIQTDRDGRGYYDFLELGKDETDFKKLIASFPDESIKRYGELGAVVVYADKRKGKVAINNRQIRAIKTLSEGQKHWRTLDFKTSIGKQNAIRVLNGMVEDATEEIGPLANGLPAFWLAQGRAVVANGKNVRQDFAPDFIAHATDAGTPDMRVRAGILDCLRCHQQVIHPIDDYVRSVLAAPLAPQSPDEVEARKLRQLYARDLQAAINQDVQLYNTATYLVSGLTSKQMAVAYQRFWTRYDEEGVSLERAAQEVGTTPEAIRASLTKWLLAGKRVGVQVPVGADGTYLFPGQVDPVLAAYLATPPRAIMRDQFDEAYVLLQLALRQYPP